MVKIKKGREIASRCDSEQSRLGSFLVCVWARAADNSHIVRAYVDLTMVPISLVTNCTG